MEKEIKAAIQEEFEQEKANLINQAKQLAESILATAKKEVEFMRKTYLQELEKTIEQDRIRLLSQLHLEAKKEILLEKEKIFNKVLDRIKKELQNLRQDKEKYRSILKSLIEEAIENFGDKTKVIVKIDKQDQELCKTVIAELQLNAKIEEMSESLGGIIVSDQEERCILNNTFASRLDKLTPVIRQRLFQTIVNVE